MEQHELNAILDALKVFSEKIDERFEKMDERFEKIDVRLDSLEQRMDERFERLEKKFDGFRVEFRETQETVDYLSSKNLQHEKKLRSIVIKED